METEQRHVRFRHIDGASLVHKVLITVPQDLPAVYIPKRTVRQGREARVTRKTHTSGFAHTAERQFVHYEYVDQVKDRE
jgi:hypothetical protein